MGSPIQILVLEDQPIDYELIQQALKRSGMEFTAARVETEEDFIRHLRTAPDVILSDHGLPQFDGLTALSLVRRVSPSLPFIFVAGTLGEEMVVESLHRGATDYVLKQHLPELAPTIERALKPKAAAAPPAPGETIELFRKAVDQAKEVVVITTPTLDLPGPQIVYVNRAFTAMTGYTEEEVLGKTPRLLQGPKTDRKVLNRLREQLSQGENFEGETVNYRKDGSEFVLAWKVTPIRNESGEITHFVSLQRDVTERIRLEAARIELDRIQAERDAAETSSKKTAELLNRVTDAFVSMDRNWCYTYVNEKAGELLGRKPDYLLGKHIWTEFPEGLGQPFQKAYELAMAEQHPVQIEAFYEPWQRWFENRIYPSPEGLSIFFQDVTEQRRNREALEASIERFEIATRVVRDIIYDWNIEEKRIRWNDNYYSVFKYDPASPHDDINIWLEHLHPDDRARTSSSLSEAIKGKSNFWQSEYRLRRGDGFYADLLDRGYIMRDSNGKALRMVGAMVDITEQKKHTQDLHDTNRRITSVLESITDAFFSLDRNWRFTYVNQQAEILLRKDREKLIGCNMWEEFPQLIGSPFEQEYKKAIQEHATRKFEAFYPELQVWLFASAYPSLEGLSVYLHDVTDRKRAEEALRASEEFSRRVIASSSDCIKVLDLEGRLLSMTEGGQRLMEISNVQQHIGQLWVDFWKNDHHEEAKAALSEARAGREGRFRGFCPTMAGTPKYWDVICTPILGPAGKPETILSVSRDISDLKAAEENRRALEARQNAIVSSALDAIITINVEGRVEDWNPAAEKLFNYSRKQALGKEVDQLFIPGQFRDLQGIKIIRDFFKRDPTGLLGKRFELTAKRADGSAFPAEVSVSKIPTEGRPLFTCFVRDISERKRAETRLRDQEERLRLIIESAQDYAIFTEDLHGKITSWNSGAEKILQYSRDEIIGQSGSIIFTSEDRAQGSDKAEIETALTNGSAQDERWHLRKNGARLWGSGQMRVVKDATGAVRGLLKILRDDTARREIEEELRKRIRQQEAVAEFGRVALVTSDLNEVCQSATRLIAKTLEMPLCGIAEYDEQRNDFVLTATVGPIEEQAGLRVVSGEQSLSGFTMSSGKAVIINDLRQERNFPGSPLLYEFQIVSALNVLIHGRERPFGVLGVFGREKRAFSEQDVNFVQSIANILSDAIERKRFEEQIQGSEERFRLIIENAKDYAIYVLDPEGNVASWNIGAERIEGYPAPEILGKNWSTLFPEEDQSRGKPQAILEMARQQGRFQEEGWRVRKDGSRFWANVTITPLYDDHGKLYGFSKILRDISSYKKAREEVEQLNVNLEERVRQRTAELLEANRELESFSYSISHDLRAPVRHIKAFGEILQESVLTKLNEEENRFLSGMIKAAQQMTQLIDDLLAFSRVLRAQLVKSTFPLRKIVDEALDSLELETRHRQVKLTIGDLPVVQGEPNMLRQVMINLLSNAFKYTAPREIAEVEIACRRNETEYIVSVRDNGVGFDMNHVDKLFGVFQRLHRNVDFEGTGIGLANVRRIIERHGGKAWAEGQLNKGATFYFSLPKEKQPSVNTEN
jgi:PAS domain S-box-containing protein